MTEKEKRQVDDLETLDDYLNIINVLDQTAGEVSNNESLDKAINSVGKALKKKVEYILRRSKKYRRPQSIFSIMRESFNKWRESRWEKREEKSRRDEEARLKLLSLQASPEAKQNQLRLEESQSDLPVAKKDNEEKDDDVLDF